jgi:hypothetical protein
MMFALDSKKLKLWITAGALCLCAMALSAQAEARGGMGGFHGGGMGGFHGGMSGFHGGMGGFHGGRGGFHGPIAFAHPGFAGSRFFVRRAFVSRPFFFHRRFADGRFIFFRRHRFVTPFPVGFDGGFYGPWAYDSGYDDYGAYQDECFVVRRRIVNYRGQVVVRRGLVCG